jgi:hypothetical protein
VITLDIHPHTLYEVECWREGRLLWVEHFPNLVTNVGRNELLDACFRTGKAAGAWYVGLVNSASFTTGYATGDTMASHGGWVEGTPYSNATRPAYIPAAASGQSLDNSASKAAFTINATLTIRGAFLVDNGTKGAGTGTLYGVGDFSIARSVLSGDTINAQITLSD